jgi:Protein of unknown function (DUF4058)
MPIHDWTRVDAGTFHCFHQRWISSLFDALNTGGLPPGYFAMAEQIIGGPVPDVVALRTSTPHKFPQGLNRAVPLATRPQARFVREAEMESYAKRADRIVVKHSRGEVIALIEIVSPGNKGSRHALRTFVEKMAALLEQGIHLLVIDLFPPSVRDPQGIHKAIWDEIAEEPFELPADKQLTTVAYSAGSMKVAYVEPVAVGDALPEMPIFLEPGLHVPVALEATYQATWSVFPAELRELLAPNQT